MCIAFAAVGLPIGMIDLSRAGTGHCDLLSVALAALAAQLLGYMALMAHFIDSDLCRRRTRREQSPSCMLGLYKLLAGGGILLDATVQIVIVGPCGGKSSVLAVSVSLVVAMQLAFVVAAGDRRVGDSAI